MNSSSPVRLPGLEDKTFLLLVVVVSLGFAWIIWPFFGAVLWGTILAILFMPLDRRLQAVFGQRRSLAALATVMLVLLLVILPFTLIGGLLIQEALGAYDKFQSGELNFSRYFQQALGALPVWMTDLLERFGLADLGSLQSKMSTSLMQGSKLGRQSCGDWAKHVRYGGQFVHSLISAVFSAARWRAAGRAHQDRCAFVSGSAPRALRHVDDGYSRHVKGNVVTAIVQGALGGLIFWILNVHAPVLWGVVMAFLSLLPAVGCALVWLPVAIFFLVTGALWKGIVLIAFGVVVIGLVDNLLRPILVGKDTKMPDYVVLVSTLGGIAIFGLNGFVIGPLIAAMFMSVWEIFAASRLRRSF